MSHKYAIPTFFFAITIVAIVVVSCNTAKPLHALATKMPESVPSSTIFYTAKGTKWIYSYNEYDTAETKPTEIITATYLFTETVVDDQGISPYNIVHIKRDEGLVTANPEWVVTESGRPTEYWYVIQSGKVYENFREISTTEIQTDTLLLAYDLPLALGKSWCPNFEEIKGVKLKDCTGGGKRTVISQEDYETPIGKFENCYKITDDFNSGVTTQWFCKGIGIVAQKYDHAGTRFGFTQVLVGYEKGVP